MHEIELYVCVHGWRQTRRGDDLMTDQVVKVKSRLKVAAVRREREWLDG